MQVNLMDEETSVHWANFTADTDKLPDMDTLVKFARHRLNTLGKINTIENPGESKQPSKPKEHKKKLTCHRLETREGKYNNDCPVCKEVHTIYSCPTFKGWNVGRKGEFARENNLCYNCLSRGHPAHRCSSTTRCKECSGRHHSYLHRTTASSDAEEEEDRSTERPKGAVNRLTIKRTDLKGGTSFTPTVMVTVTAGGCVQAVKTLIDQGAGMNLITARLANQLKARPQPNTNDITCVKGDVDIKDQVDLVVAAMFGTEEQELEITALVMDHITSDSPADDLRDIKDSEVLQGLNLADPNWDKPGRINLLLGSKDQVLHSRDRRLTAQDTIFGWMIGGSTAGEKTSRQRCLASKVRKAPADNMLKIFWELECVPGESTYFTSDEQAAVSGFDDTVIRTEDGRYSVQLTRKMPTPVLGDSRKMAKSRLQQSRRLMKKKGKLSEFEAAVAEYACRDGSL